VSIANKLSYANRTYRAHFVQQLEAGRAQYQPSLDALMMKFKSTGPGDEHSFTDAIPGLTEWIDERSMGKLGAQSFYVANKPYAAGIEVDRDDLEDDRLGLYFPRIRQLADMYWRHRFEALRDLINNGASTTIWDGKAFFANDHPLADSSSVNDNFNSDAMSEAAVQSAITQLRNLKDSQGRLLNLAPTHLIYGNDLEWTAMDILKQERQSTGETNVMRGALTGLMIPGLTATTWAVADLSKSLKPFMFQDRRPVEFSSQTNLDSDDVFMRKNYKWGVDYRGRSYYAFYQTMVYSEG
jgi:phage major head subunit gpT-like protein